jgi:hypothetical protein
MAMRFFWVADAVAKGKFDIKYSTGKGNRADYWSKHHTGTHHVEAILGIYMSPRLYKNCQEHASPAL